MDEQNTPPSNRLGINKEHLAAYNARRASIAQLTEELLAKYTYEQLAEVAAKQMICAAEHEELIRRYEKKCSELSELLLETLEQSKGSIPVKTAAKLIKAAIDAKEAPIKKRRKEIYYSSLGGKAEAHKKLVERAKTIADDKWKESTGEIIRMGDMADIVYRKLTAEGFSERLPDDIVRIREWIKPVAPDAASRPGPNRKPPNR